MNEIIRKITILIEKLFPEHKRIISEKSPLIQVYFMFILHAIAILGGLYALGHLIYNFLEPTLILKGIINPT